ncbi:hypothetical protein PV664_36705 [Streptomyces sp. ME01-18a]|uniref:hypothetical protein n=1 Tax=Streptomyces sp. ME01-18a TaxID=3028669 RepID=UPI0029B59EF3|nr:hypothetical protein [Streptomyces sp. ME01-18a]MDX3434367.1 hypothetical protein [Streptomyces sp. ME01-18a]
MYMWTRAVPAVLSALAIAALSGCSGSGTPTTGDKESGGQMTYRLGEASPPQKHTMQKYKGGTFTVTPTKVETGTKADLEASGLQLDASDVSKIPVYVSATLTHKSGKAMAIGDLDDDLVVRTNKDERSRSLVVLMGQAKWPNCPAVDFEKLLRSGQSESICSVFLIPEGQKPATVELTQGFTSAPLEWSVNN